MADAPAGRIARDLGLISWLDRLGARPLVGEAVRRMGDPAYRSRWAAVREDFRACAPLFRRIAEGIPEGRADRPALMISSFSPVFGIKLEAILALASRLGGWRPVILEANPNPWIRRYHRLFGHRRFVDFRRERAAAPGLAQMRAGFDETAWAGLDELMALDYRGVDVGRIALSAYLNRCKFESLDLEREETRAEISRDLERIVRNVEVAERIVDRVRPVVALVLEKGLPPAAEVVGVCLARDIPVVQYCGSQRADEFVLKRFDHARRHDHPFSLHPETWRRVREMAWTVEREEALMREFRDGYELGTWFGRKYLHQDKAIARPEEIERRLGLDPAKKTAVIFSHVLWDATFFYGANLFGDYETWLLETIRAASLNPQVNWVVKLHPDLAWKLKVEGHEGAPRDFGLIERAGARACDHIRIVPHDTDVSTYSFFGMTDYCLTVRGTVGIEMACHGVPVLTAGSGRYSGLGFTIDSGSREDYLARLASIQDLPPLDSSRRALAQRFAHALFDLRPWRLESFEVVQKSIDAVNDPLAMNLLPRIADAARFQSAPDILGLVDWLDSDAADYLAAEI